MAEVKWIKLSTELFNNRKIKQIECLPEGNAIIVMWVKLLCLAGNINDSGQIYFTKEIPYTDQMLSTQFNIPLTTVQLALKIFEQFEMIEVIDDILFISNWEKYQNVESLATIREQNRKRVAKHREKKRLEACNVTSNVTVTQCNAIDIDKDIDKEEDKEKDNKSKRKTASRFKAPTVEEVKAYCLERKNNVDAERFVDYYTSNGWKVGKQSMKDWKAAVRTWERNGFSNTQNKTNSQVEQYSVKDEFFF